jgi:NADP-dependent 3-hydroxy acid dehydrogenase YdfG
MIEVNIAALTKLTHLYLPDMRERNAAAFSISLPRRVSSRAVSGGLQRDKGVCSLVL